MLTSTDLWLPQVVSRHDDAMPFLSSLFLKGKLKYFLMFFSSFGINCRLKFIGVRLLGRETVMSGCGD